jgi:hypothetical protein
MNKPNVTQPYLGKPKNVSACRPAGNRPSLGGKFRIHMKSLARCLQVAYLCRVTQGDKFA